MCGGGGGIDLGIGKLNFSDTLKTIGLGVVGAPVYDALIQNQQDLAKKGLAAQEQANQVAIDNFKKQADLADQANNRANGKQPDIGAMLSKNILDAKGGQSGTMLTGAAGIDPNSLLLGKKTLLGG